jgi:hypothetical protein
MPRQRRKQLRRRRRLTATAVFGAVLAIAVGVPALASANTVDDLLHNLGLGGTGGGGGSAATPQAGVPPTYTPPLHTTDPHGEASVATIDASPSDTNPYPVHPTPSEIVGVGDSRGEQSSSGYKGTVTLAYLLGSPIVQVTTNPGETKDGPLQPLQDGLDQICSDSSELLCLTVLGVHSATTNNSSDNSFEAFGAGIGPLSTTLLNSHGSASNDSSCQTTHGDSSIASGALASGAPATDTPVSADLFNSSSSSTACNDGSQSVDQSSSAAAFQAGGFSASQAEDPCADGTPNTSYVSPPVAIVCNADDTNGSQTASPYGVREALNLFLDLSSLRETNVASVPELLKVTLAGSESHAVAPPSAPGSPGSGAVAGATKTKKPSGGSPSGDVAPAGTGPVAGSPGSAPRIPVLAFTGADLLVLGAIGCALVLAGFVLSPIGGRRRRTTI